MLGAIGPDGSIAIYLAMGMVAAVNPCGFAMLPAYLSYFLGLDPKSASMSSAPAREPETANLARALRVAAAVSAGFLVVFAVAGLAVKQAELPIYEYMPWISLVIGAALVALGIAMVAGYDLITRLPKLARGGHDRTAGSMFVFGVSYAIASIGCTLPTFLTAVGGTMTRESVLDGVIVFGIYAAGMAVVLTALTVAMALARTSVLRFLRSAQEHIRTVSGVLVALAGLYVVYYGALELRTYRSEGGNVPSSRLTDTVSGWSYDISDWITRTGPVRLFTALALSLTATGLAVQAMRSRKRNELAPEGRGVDGPSGARTRV